MELSCDQINAKIKINSFLNDKFTKFFLLKGSAGTGKTTLITNILNGYKKNIALCATTHKAVSVLKKMKLDDNKNLTFVTIHKLLKIKRVINADGRQVFKSNIKDDKLNNKSEIKSIYYYDIIIIDECSMIEQKLLDTIIGLENKIKGKIIFIGDICQLPPVNEKNSKVFKYNLENYELKKIMRYKGEIVNLCNDIRKLIIDHSFKLKLNKYKSKKIVFYKNSNSFIEHFIKKFKKEEKEFPIGICYTNKRCNYINNRVRDLLFENTKNNKFVKDELIIFNNFYKTTNNVYYTSQKEKINDIMVEEFDLNNFDTNILKLLDEKIIKYFENFAVNEYEKNCVIIIKLKLLDKLDVLFDKIKNLDIRIYNIKLYNNDKIISIYKDDMDKYELFLENCKKLIRKIFNWLNTSIKMLEDSVNIYKSFINKFWDLFYNKLIDKFSDIDYGYCITTHKSQASTFKNIYVDMNNIIKCNSNINESYRCLYTAITRSSNRVNILL